MQFLFLSKSMYSVNFQIIKFITQLGGGKEERQKSVLLWESVTFLVGASSSNAKSDLFFFVTMQTLYCLNINNLGLSHKPTGYKNGS